MTTGTEAVADVPREQRFPGRAGPAILTAVGLVAVVSAHGGYVPTSWGWSSVVFALILVIWLGASGRTDAGRTDAVFLGLLTLLVAWIGLSAAWSVHGAATVLELERALVLVGGSASFLVLARRPTVPPLAAAILAAIGLVSLYALSTRLFPDRLGTFDPDAVYRLSAPVGYWNGLGILAVMGILLAAGVAADAGSWAARWLAAAMLVVLPTTLLFTYSRASWVALVLGLATTIAVSSKRLRLLATLAAASPAALVAVLAASRSDTLTHQSATLAAAAHDGRRLALLLVVLAAVAVLCVEAVTFAARRATVPPTVRRAAGAAVLVVVALAAAGAIGHFGGPGEFARRGYDSFAAPPPPVDGSLNDRLFNVSSDGRVELWRFALRTYRSRPLLGTGAGTFERRWQANPDAKLEVRDAHSLYLETLAELGPVGLALLLLALGTPLAVGVGVSRKRPYIPAALGAYSAFLVHAGVDWDWELSGVTLTAVLIASLVLVSARGSATRTIGTTARFTGITVVLLAGAFAAVGLLGNTALARATDMVNAERNANALAPAARARRWMPWSAEPLVVQGEAELGAGHRAAARSSFSEAIAMDDSEWRSWLGLALASSGAEQTRAFARAQQLYPTSPEISEARGTAPTISGTAKVGATLTVSNGTWATAPSSFLYAWHLCSTTGHSCHRSPTSTLAPTYAITSADVGYAIVAQVAPNGDWSRSANSAPTRVAKR
jgi:hypothetical protein